MKSSAPTTSLDAALHMASGRLDAAEARLLLAHALGRPASWLYAHGGDVIDPPALRRFERLLESRIRGRPIAYLTGTRGFWTLELEVNPDTLIPRPETERLVELALGLPAGTPARVADLGTGTGAIALAIAKERPQARIVATDASAGALAVARRNALINGIDNVEFRQGSWLTPLTGENYDLIVSNPPYIAEGDPHLRQGDLRFEPASALASGRDGLNDIREIVADAAAYLHAGGWLLLEHGLDQAAAVRALLEAAGFVEVRTEQDLELRDRVTLGRKG